MQEKNTKSLYFFVQTFAWVAHPFPICLRKHLMKSTIISVICTNMRNENKFMWLS